MAPKLVAGRRLADRRSRQERADAERLGGGRRVAPPREPRDRLGPVAWGVILLVGFFLVDAFVWQGYYRHALSASVAAKAAVVRGWSNDAWRSTLP